MKMTSKDTLGRILHLSLIAILWAWPMRPAEAADNLRKCATEQPARKKSAIEAQLSAFKKKFSAMRAVDVPINVKVYFHVLTNSDKSKGHLEPASLKKQIDVLNKFYQSSNIKFELAGSEEIANDKWFNMGYHSKEEHDAKTAGNQAHDPHDYLNIYTADIAGGILGWATFPADLDLNDEDHGPTWDGLVLLYTTFPGGPEVNYNEGMTAVHESGHWLGLYHTFEGGCTPPGDYVDDTRPQSKQPNVGCPTTDAENNTCADGGSGHDLPTIHNHMNYLYDRCMTEFTPGQNQRMRDQVGTYRPHLFSKDVRHEMNFQPVDLSEK